MTVPFSHELPVQIPPDHAITTNGGTPAGLHAIPLSSVRRERVETLFDEGRIPLGEVTEINGFEAVGKGLTSVMIAARLSREGKHTLFLSGEDSPEATLRPRLEAAGADLDYTHVLPVDAILSLPDDGAKLFEVVRALGATLVVIDPLVSYLAPRINSWNDHSVRQALAPLRLVATELRCAVLLIRHLNKGQSEHVRDRVGGSIAFRAFVRSALLLGRDPDDPDDEASRRRIFAHTKCNYGPQMPSQLLEIEAVTLPADEEQDEVETARLKLIGASTVGGDALLQRLGVEERADRNEVDEFTLQALASGDWVDAKTLDTLGQEAGFSIAQLSKSRTRLKRTAIEKRKTGQPGDPGIWQWRLARSEQEVPT